jgi:hypothetical protein
VLVQGCLACVTHAVFSLSSQVTLHTVCWLQVEKRFGEALARNNELRKEIELQNKAREQFDQVGGCACLLH